MVSGNIEKAVSKSFFPFEHQEQQDNMKGIEVQTRVNLMNPRSYEMLRDNPEF